MRLIKHRVTGAEATPGNWTRASIVRSGQPRQLAKWLLVQDTTYHLALGNWESAQHSVPGEVASSHFLDLGQSRNLPASSSHVKVKLGRDEAHEDFNFCAPDIVRPPEGPYKTELQNEDKGIGRLVFQAFFFSCYACCSDCYLIHILNFHASLALGPRTRTFLAPSFNPCIIQRQKNQDIVRQSMPWCVCFLY